LDGASNLEGSISFGLVNIPIALYPATRREEFKFRPLRKSDLSPINYKRVAEKDGKDKGNPNAQTTNACKKRVLSFGLRHFLDTAARHRSA
jgi:hypothetical protein